MIITGRVDGSRFVRYENVSRHPARWGALESVRRNRGSIQITTKKTTHEIQGTESKRSIDCRFNRGDFRSRLNDTLLCSNKASHSCGGHEQTEHPRHLRRRYWDYQRQRL